MKKKRLSVFWAFLFLFIGTVVAQSKLTGTIISAENDEPIIGATVSVQGSNVRTVTNVDGAFTLNVNEGTTIVVSYVGMATQTLKAKNGMTVRMNPNQTLQEVVVTGMTTTDKRLFTGSTTKIDAADAKINGMADVSRSLEGRAAGVSVQNVSGTFGTAPKIRVRGATSIYGDSKPLWVVDGVIMEDVVDVSADQLSSGDAETLISSAIAGLNSDDIESFQILKDGSATSIYGARAMAGVIVITTKRGKAGQAHINYMGEYTMRLIPSYRQLNLMNSQEQMDVYQDMEQKGWLKYAETANASNSGVYGKMYQMLSEYNPVTGQFALANTPDAKAAYLRNAEFRNTDWFNELFSNTVMHNHSVSISAGSDKAQYYASLSAMFDPGWTRRSNVQRYTANLNATFKLSKKLQLNLISTGNYRKQEAPGTLAASTNVVTGEVSRDFDINPYSYAVNTSRTLDRNTFYTSNYAPFNILHELQNNFMDLNVNDFRAQAKLSYKPITKVDISVLGAVKYAGTSREHHVTEYSNQAEAYRAMQTTVIRQSNSYLYHDPDNIFALPFSVMPYGGIITRADNRMFGWDFRASVSYNDVFNKDHILNTYAGMETNSYTRHNTWFKGYGLQYDLGEEANWAYQNFKKMQEGGNDYYGLGNTNTRSAAFFGNVTYSWKGRYTINGTLRYEGTNGLGLSRQSRWLPTWNVSGAWNAHEESWFDQKLGKVLSHLTLKASYSLTADRPPVTNALAIIKANTPWRYRTGNTETGLERTSPANPDLTYEKKHELNLGLDAGFLNNRINMSVDWYKRNNYDLVGPIPTDGTDGFLVKYGNVAAMKSNGVELSLSTTNLKTKDFSWKTNFIYSYVHNEITDLKARSRMINFISGVGYARKGYPSRALFSVPFMGLTGDGLPTFRDQEGNISITNVNFQESDPEKLKFLKYEGPTDPTNTGSLGNVFTYKGFTLNVFVTYSFGNVVRLYPAFKSRYTDLSAMPKEFRNRWRTPGDEAYTDIPTIATLRQVYDNPNLYRAYNAYNYSDARIAKGDFIRMKELSLNYDFPQKLVGYLGLRTASVKVQGTNLFLIYADKKLNGQDPEFFNTGGVAVPMAKQFTLTLKVGL